MAPDDAAPPAASMHGTPRPPPSRHGRCVRVFAHLVLSVFQVASEFLMRVRLHVFLSFGHARLHLGHVGGGSECPGGGAVRWRRVAHPASRRQATSTPNAALSAAD
eukprot:365747-Chlamydomonas_euryale.AAC.63